MGDKDAEKWLKKSKLASAYETLPSPELRQAVVVEYGRLLKENDLSDPMLAVHFRNAILPAVAVHRCLQEHGYTQSASLMIIRTAVLAAAKPMAGFFQRMGRLPFFFHSSASFAQFLQNAALARKGGCLNGNGMMRMQSNGTAMPACIQICFADTICRSWRLSSVKVMM